VQRTFTNIGVVGAGLIGASWAAFYASKGKRVSVYDPAPQAAEKARSRAVGYLRGLADHKMLATESLDAAEALLHVAVSLEDAVRDADLIQESAKESYEVKSALFADMERAALPTAVMVTSTSMLSISRIQEGLQHPERTPTVHPFNPPHLVPLVELVAGDRTDPEVVTMMQTFFRDLGKAPVLVNREIIGHIANRFQAAVWREAIDLVLNGVATVRDVDRALSAGPGLRWALMGQHLTFHLGGGEGGIESFMDHIGTSYPMIWESLAAWTDIPEGARATIADGVEEEMAGRSLPDLEEWRDAKLYELLNVIHNKQEA